MHTSSWRHATPIQPGLITQKPTPKAARLIYKVAPCQGMRQMDNHQQFTQVFNSVSELKPN